MGGEVDHGVVSDQGASQARDVEQVDLDRRSAKLAEEIAVVSRSRDGSNPVSGGDHERHCPSPNLAGRAGDENAHVNSLM